MLEPHLEHSKPSPKVLNEIKQSLEPHLPTVDAVRVLCMVQLAHDDFEVLQWWSGDREETFHGEVNESGGRLGFDVAQRWVFGQPVRGAMLVWEERVGEGGEGGARGGGGRGGRAGGGHLEREVRGERVELLGGCRLVCCMVTMRVVMMRHGVRWGEGSRETRRRSFPCPRPPPSLPRLTVPSRLIIPHSNVPVISTQGRYSRT